MNINRIGPAQRTVLRILVQNGGRYYGKTALAAMVGPNGSSAFGGQTIERCLHHGWIRYERTSEGRGHLVVLTDAGWQVWDQLTGDAS